MQHRVDLGEATLRVPGLGVVSDENQHRFEQHASTTDGLAALERESVLVMGASAIDARRPLPLLSGGRATGAADGNLDCMVPFP